MENERNEQLSLRHKRLNQYLRILQRNIQNHHSKAISAFPGIGKQNESDS
jgi:hypothetical protein